jgi:hypothetical protein
MLEQDRWPLPSQFPIVDRYSSTDWDSRADVTDGFEEGTHFFTDSDRLPEERYGSEEVLIIQISFNELPDRLPIH